MKDDGVGPTIVVEKEFGRSYVIQSEFERSTIT